MFVRFLKKLNKKDKKAKSLAEILYKLSLRFNKCPHDYFFGRQIDLLIDMAVFNDQEPDQIKYEAMLAGAKLLNG